MMTTILGQITNNVSSNCINKNEVYIATIPLRAPKGPAQWIMSTAYTLNLWNLQHYMVIIKPSSPQYTEALVYDFQPKDPENIFVAVTALSGKKVPGVVLERKLTKIPRNNCWFAGCSNMDEDGVQFFNESWDKNLKINDHDCTDYTKGSGYSFTSKCRCLRVGVMTKKIVTYFTNACPCKVDRYHSSIVVCQW